MPEEGHHQSSLAHEKPKKETGASHNEEKEISMKKGEKVNAAGIGILQVKKDCWRKISSNTTGLVAGWERSDGSSKNR